MRQHMSRALRAKQFMPFSALKGYEEAVRESEKRSEPRRLLGEDAAAELDGKLRSLRTGDRVCVLHYDKGEYLVLEGRLEKIDHINASLCVSGRDIALRDIYDAEKM